METTFADDMNMYKPFLRSINHNEILADLSACQRSLHRWGNGNRVVFDPGKESFHVLHRLAPARTELNILGVVFDNHLSMHAAVRVVAVQAGWRVKAILRSRLFFSKRELVHLFKAQVLSYIEAGISAFIHAPPSTMKPIDRIHSRFLREIALSEADAALNFGLLPFGVRRQIAALGFIHQRVLGLSPELICNLLPWKDVAETRYATRLATSLHRKQLWDAAMGKVTEIFKRSVFEFVGVYNRLPRQWHISAM